MRAEEIIYGLQRHVDLQARQIIKQGRNLGDQRSTIKSLFEERDTFRFEISKLKEIIITQKNLIKNLTALKEKFKDVFHSTLAALKHYKEDSDAAALSREVDRLGKIINQVQGFNQNQVKTIMETRDERDTARVEVKRLRSILDRLPFSIKGPVKSVSALADSNTMLSDEVKQQRERLESQANTCYKLRAALKTIVGIANGQ